MLEYVVDNLTNDEGKTGLASKMVEDTAPETCISISFRLCMANVLISTCQKIPESVKKAFAQKTLPRLIRLTQVCLLV